LATDLSLKLTNKLYHKFYFILEILYQEIIHSHEYTPWVCCFSPDSPNIFLSGKKNKNYYDINNLNIGGDDMKLIQYDLRCGEGNNKIAQINKKLKKNISK